MSRKIIFSKGNIIFQLTKEEFENIRFQIDILNQSMSSQIVMTYPTKRPNSFLHYVFTEQRIGFKK